MSDTASAAHGPGHHVLVVDDVPVIRLLITRLLSLAGYRVTTANDGGEALEQMERRRPEDPFVIVLMDLYMPVLNGTDVVRALRARGDVTPVIALSAAVSDEERDECLRAGCCDYLDKPIDRARLLAAVSRHSKTAA